MTEPQWLDVATPAVQLRALTWGPADAPIALCLHGFPDTAYGWRKIAPQLVDAGWRVVAPFMRGYVPSSLPSDGSYHVGALMDDALRVLDAAGATERRTARRAPATSAPAQLVHHVLPITLAARAFGGVGGAAVVA